MITVREFYMREGKRLWRGKHFNESMSKLNKFCNFEGYGERGIDSFIPLDIYKYLDTLSDIDGFTDNTVNHYAAAISVVFNHAVDMEVITHAPRIKWRKVKSGRPRYMTKEEIVKLKAFLVNDKNSWMEHFVTIGLNTGMRLGEILKIGESAFLTEERDWLVIPDTKNGDERIVPITRDTLAAIDALDGRPGKYYSHRKFYNTWKNARKQIANGDKTFVFHVLRHTCATTMANDHQVNSHLIGTMLGHRSVETTRKYIHAKPESLMAIAKKLSKAVN